MKQAVIKYFGKSCIQNLKVQECDAIGDAMYTERPAHKKTKRYK